MSAPASYLVAFALPALDALIPLVPSEAAVIGLGVATAGSADPRIAVLIMLAAAGAFVGDNVAYLLGRRYGGPAARRFLAGERAVGAGPGPNARWTGSVLASSSPAGSFPAAGRP